MRRRRARPDQAADELSQGRRLHVSRPRPRRSRCGQLFVDVFQRVNKLKDEPEFYNTFTNNCTTNIVRHVNNLAPDRVPYDYRVLLPGLAGRAGLRPGAVGHGRVVRGDQRACADQRSGPAVRRQPRFLRPDSAVVFAPAGFARRTSLRYATACVVTLPSRGHRHEPMDRSSSCGWPLWPDGVCSPRDRYAYPGGYQVAVADLNADGRPDVSPCPRGRSGRLVRESFLAATPHRPHARRTSIWPCTISMATADRRSPWPAGSTSSSPSRRRDPSLAAAGQPSRTNRGRVHPIATDPVVHRLRWGDLDGDGRAELVHAPLFGPGSQGHARSRSRPTSGRFASRSKPAQDPWKPWKIDETLTVLHGIHVGDLDSDGRDEILTASFEGICRFDFEGSGADGALAENPIRRRSRSRSAEEPGPPAAPAKSCRARPAAKEPAFWRPSSLGTGTNWWSTAGPNGSWQRHVLDDTLREGHALVVADFDGDGATKSSPGGGAGAEDWHVRSGRARGNLARRSRSLGRRGRHSSPPTSTATAGSIWWPSVDGQTIWSGMTTLETLQDFIRGLAQHGEQPAIIAMRKDRVETWSFAGLADRARQLAAGFRRGGPDARVACASVCPQPPRVDRGLFRADPGRRRAGADRYPDDRRRSRRWSSRTARPSGSSPPPDSCGGWTTSSAAARSEDRAVGCRGRRIRPVGDTTWSIGRSHLPKVQPGDRAVLFYTSGTSGPPKGVPLTHRNIVSNLEVGAGAEAAAAGRPHAAALAVAPRLSVQPRHLHSLDQRRGDHPAAVAHRAADPAGDAGGQGHRPGRRAAAAGRLGLGHPIADRTDGPRGLGRVRRRLAAVDCRPSLDGACGWDASCSDPCTRRFAPHLRLVACGGSALDSQLAWRMEGLGWAVATGYGLTETSPLLTFTVSGDRRPEATGRPCPGWNCASSSSRRTPTHGEVQAKGPNVFAGYHNLPDRPRRSSPRTATSAPATWAISTSDGFLYLVGRASSMIVLAGGENVRPENVEEALERGAHIHEAARLGARQPSGGPAVPDRRRAFATQTSEAELDDADSPRGRAAEPPPAVAPSHRRLRDRARSAAAHPFGQDPPASAPRALRGGAPPRVATRPRRSGPISLDRMAPEHRQLLEDPTARKVWDILCQRFTDVRLAPDSNVQLDLGVDSMEWLNLTLEIRQQTGADLDQEAIAKVETVADLLQQAVEAGQERHRPGRHARDAQAARGIARPPTSIAGWSPATPWQRSFGETLVGAQSAGDDAALPSAPRARESSAFRGKGPVLFTPNHRSLLDPPARSAPACRRRCWPRPIGPPGPASCSAIRLMRLVSRAVHVMPVAGVGGTIASLAFGVAVLQRGNNLVWFPEGGRSDDGQLQRLQTGVGLLLLAQPVPVVPVWVQDSDGKLPAEVGTFQAPFDRRHLRRAARSPAAVSRRHWRHARTTDRRCAGPADRWGSDWWLVADGLVKDIRNSHSERSEESGLTQQQTEILRCAQNDCCAVNGRDERGTSPLFASHRPLPPHFPHSSTPIRRIRLVGHLHDVHAVPAVVQGQAGGFWRMQSAKYSHSAV